MKLSTKTRYGTRALLELSKHYGQGPLQIKAIAKSQDISAKYLEQLIGLLKSSGFVISVRGSRGGYLLSKQPKKIKLSEVFTSLEGPVKTADCTRTKDICPRASDCVMRQLWAKVEGAIEGVLKSYTLEDLCDMLNSNERSDYQI